ncbi:MAG: 16S rRNA (cytosine(967)-C(5))-methyltransferase RsmB [Candidatus Sericytochromatia bacterium]|nr:16S rRNA (cytosine(967)-C(5))-methyltransferase RsmB [Candidatus Sericytochromatia bacterium]
MRPERLAANLDARQLALTVLRQWEQNHQPLDEVLDCHLTGPSTVDTRLATELVYGVVRRMGTLDWRLNSLLKQPLTKLPPVIALILRIGAYQLLYLDRIPASAAVHEAVEQAKRHGHAGTVKLTNAVLRSLQRAGDTTPLPEDPNMRLAATASVPPWLAKRWIPRYGEAEATTLARAMIQQAPQHLRVNMLRTGPPAVLAAFTAADIAAEALSPFAEGIHVLPGSGISGWPGFTEGWWYVQDLGSMAVAHAVAPRPGDTVIDLCAAPGGKTTHMAALMADEGRILAVDMQARRLERVQENVQRLGITCIETRVGDAATLVPDRLADRVLVDAPCSGLGVMRRKPDIRWRVTTETLKAILPVQQAILRAAAAWVKPGGILVYSTCSTEPEENGAQIAAFLADYPEFEAVAMPDTFPDEWLAGQPLGQVSLLPPRHGSDGFFIARMQRRKA